MHQEPARVRIRKGCNMLACGHTCICDNTSTPSLRKACLHGARLRARKLKQTRQEQLGVFQVPQSMLTTGSRMLITYTSACMQLNDVAMHALADDMNCIIYVNVCECSGATRCYSGLTPP
eukprot:4833291-Pleurochrysis_carterae.AAC.1